MFVFQTLENSGKKALNKLFANPRWRAVNMDLSKVSHVKQIFPFTVGQMV